MMVDDEPLTADEERDLVELGQILAWLPHQRTWSRWVRKAFVRMHEIGDRCEDVAALIDKLALEFRQAVRIAKRQRIICSAAQSVDQRSRIRRDRGGITGMAGPPPDPKKAKAAFVRGSQALLRDISLCRYREEVYPRKAVFAAGNLPERIFAPETAVNAQLRRGRR